MNKNSYDPQTGLWSWTESVPRTEYTVSENNSISISFNRTISAYTIVIENDSLEKCLVTLRELYKEFPQYNNVENEIEFSY